MEVSKSIEAFSNYCDKYLDQKTAFLKVENGDKIKVTVIADEASSVDDIINFTDKLLSENKDLTNDDKKKIGNGLRCLGVILENETSYDTNVEKINKVIDYIKTNNFPSDVEDE